MDTALAAPEGRLPGLEDIWLQLHLVFECIWDYRFLYRDLVDILSRNRRLRLRFARILKRADEQAHAVMRGLSQAGVMRASAAELDAAATNVLVIATFWLNYASARGDKDEQALDPRRHRPGDDAAGAVPARRRTRAPQHPDPRLHRLSVLPREPTLRIALTRLARPRRSALRLATLCVARRQFHTGFAIGSPAIRRAAQRAARRGLPARHGAAWFR